MTFYRVGSRPATLLLAVERADRQALTLACPRCAVGYVTQAVREAPTHRLAEVSAYPDVAEAFDLADERLMLECPDHAYQFDIDLAPSR